MQRGQRAYEHDRRETGDRRINDVVEKRAEAREAEQRVIASRRKPRQTRAMFVAMVEAYCAKKGQRNGLRRGRTTRIA